MDNSAFSSFINTSFLGDKTRKGVELSQYNLIDVGIITDVCDGLCTVKSYTFVDGKQLTYKGLELIYPGGTGSFNPTGMTCVILFPPLSTGLDEGTINMINPYFSYLGGKVIPVSTNGTTDVAVGPAMDGSYHIAGEKTDLTLASDGVRLSISNGSVLSLDINTRSITLWLDNNIICISYDFETDTARKVRFDEQNRTPVSYEVSLSNSKWTGWYNTTKPIDGEDINYDITAYVMSDFKFVEVQMITERQFKVYDEETLVCSIIVDNTGEIGITTDEKVTLEAKKDVTVNRDGTKLEVKNGKVVVTGDLEVSGKATINGITTVTGMGTDLKNFLTVLMSGLTPMYTLGSPATHQPDGNYKSKMSQAQGYL